MEDFGFLIMDDTIDISNILDDLEESKKVSNDVIPSEEDLQFIIELLGLKEDDD
jgi:hypothetical protein